jgi:probable HAF family extracellular repeat protein
MKACEPTAINNQANVTGIASVDAQTTAFLYYSEDGEAEMESMGGLNSRGFGINSSGVVVGDAFIPGQLGSVSHAALFKEKEALDLGALKGHAYSQANGINAMNQVVGFSGPKRAIDESRAFIWTDKTGMIDIGTLGGAYARANAVNDIGFVTGTSQIVELGRAGAPAATHAFVYQPLSWTEQYTDKMRDLGTLGGNSSYGMSINARNHVVGYSTLYKSEDRVHAFFHNGAKMADLGSLGGNGAGDYSVALGVNNADQVVGFSYIPSGGKRAPQQAAFLWSPRNKRGTGEMINLNKLIGTAAESYQLLSATAINDSGQIVATAYNSDGNVRAVLLTPIFAGGKR